MQNAAIALVEHPDKKGFFLWIKRKDIPIWVLPGGGIDRGETPEEAVCREVFEESGLKVCVVRKTACYTAVNRWTADTHVFLCSWEAGEPIITEESCAFGYFDTPPSPSFPLHPLWLNEALTHPEVTIHRPLNEFSWVKVGAYFLKHPYILMKYLLTHLTSLRAS